MTITKKLIPESAIWRRFRLHCIEHFEFGDVSVKMHEGEPVKLIPEKTIQEIRFDRPKKKNNGVSLTN